MDALDVGLNGGRRGERAAPVVAQVEPQVLGDEIRLSRLFVSNVRELELQMHGHSCSHPRELAQHRVQLVHGLVVLIGLDRRLQLRVDVVFRLQRQTPVLTQPLKQRVMYAQKSSSARP